MAKSRKVTEGKGWSLLPPDPEPAPAPAAPGAKPAKAPRPRISVEKRPGGKVVTRLANLGETMSEADLAAWLKRLKAAFGTGGAGGPDWIELQGDRREALLEAARTRGIRV